jgi:DNA-binding MarR family transcriptional regulator
MHDSTAGPLEAPDRESRVRDDDHGALRLWLRLLTCTMLIERDIKARLRERFGMSLARFDLMAQLERSPHGLKMSELSRRLMVSGGNVTSLTDQLVGEGLVERRAMRGDRRAFLVRLTASGRRSFLAMAREHERWIVDLTSELPAADRERLHALLGRLKGSLSAKETT